MPTKEQAEEAKKILDEYNAEFNRKFITVRKCICCKKNVVKPLEGIFGFSFESTSPLDQHDDCWSNGAVELIHFGYGSSRDTNSFFIAICDDCITQLEKEGLATNYKTLMREINKAKELVPCLLNEEPHSISKEADEFIKDLNKKKNG